MQPLNLKYILELIQADIGSHNRPEPNSTMTKFAAKMRREGFKEIGSGAMALVYHKQGENDVLKAFRHDQCFLKYLTLISNNQENPHFPKIIQYENLKTEPYAGLHLVKMEKLESVNDNESLKVLAIIKDLTEELNLLNDFSDHKQEYLDLIEQLKSSLAKAVNDNANPNRNIYHAVELIAKGITGTQCSPDLHRHNIMRRNDGTLVIIDPFI